MIPSDSPPSPSTTVAILGAGRVASALATGLTRAGRRPIIGARQPQESAARWTGPSVTFAAPAEAIRAAELVIHATPGASALAFLTGLRAELPGKVLIDVANATVRSEAAPLGELCYPGSSLAEQLQEALPDTRVVKTLNTMMSAVMADPQGLSTPPTAFLSGDDPGAKASVRALLGELGWPAEWVLDLGGVGTARGTEALFLFVPFLVRSLGFSPFGIGVAR